MVRSGSKALFGILVLTAVMATLAACLNKPPVEPDSEKLAAVTEPITSPGWIRFRPEAKVNARGFLAEYAGALQLADGTEMRSVGEETDELALTHLRYQQYYRNVEVEGAEFLVRAKGDDAISANGQLALNFAPQVVEAAIDEEHALAIVRQRMMTSSFYDGAHLVEALKSETSNHVPRGTLMFTSLGSEGERALAWRFDAYVNPINSSRRLYIDAATGAIIKEIELLPGCYTTNAVTSFRGSQTFNTAQTNIPGLGNRFILMDDCHGNQLREQSFNVTSGTSKEVFDSDNDWSDQDRGLVTSFWALGVVYDYFDLVLKRKSYDNKNANMLIINNPNTGQGANGGAGVITIGIAGPGPNDDYNTTDIVGHEFTHSVIETSAKLGYDTSKESAALNESFSDIFGTMADAWEKRTQTPSWIIGADKGCVAPAVCRNLINPKAFSQPDTYKGNFWQSAGTIDPHVNGTVQNRWFALLATGGSGTNAEIGVPFNITGIGIAKAQRIAFRTLTRYLISSSNYFDARDGSIQAAVDLFGPGSPEEGAVTQSWCAVGLCPFTIPKQPDRFDRIAGNPNPASPNNNNTEAGATPIASSQWSIGRRPTLSIADLSVFGIGDVDYFRIDLPEVSLVGGDCFPSGVAVSFTEPVDARVLVGGTVTRSIHNATYFKLGGTSGSFVLQVSSPFPNLILDYAIKASFYQSVDPHCWQTEPPNVFQQIEDCPMCDIGLLAGHDDIILDPDYRRPDLISPSQHYFAFDGGDLNIPIDVVKGNALNVDLVKSDGAVIKSTSWAAGSTISPSLNATGLSPGIYSLRFSNFGNGTEVKVRAPGP